MPQNFYPATSLIGGGTGALDAIDGTDLNDKDGAIVITTSGIYVYSLDADSAQSESSPTIIAPDTNAGDKRWILEGETVPHGTNTGDIIRYNAISGVWESKAEPLEFTEILLTPTDSPSSDAEGAVYYDASDKAIYVSIG